MNTEQFQIFMFHFRCPVCAASPKRVLLREYLHRWSDAPPERLHSLLCTLSGAITEVRHGQSHWFTKEFGEAADSLLHAIEELRFDPPIVPDSSLRALEPASLHFDVDCPVCQLPPGPRKPDRYFTDWPHAGKVQTGNLLYETGLIFWAILVGLPSWAPGPLLQKLNTLRGQLRVTGKAMSVFECPQCGRLTTCLYGANPKQNGFCRWCLDMGGGLGIGISVTIGANLDVDVKMTQTDHTEPGRNSWDILPPEIKR